MEQLTIPVRGMSCEGCVKSVTRVLSALPGVQGVQVSLAAANASLQYDPASSPRQVIAEAIRVAGFETDD
ncbi:heavy-metal-associated domain-containing protein [Uliginosibacterium gangwonense]|uniref:heavy-metal-associated domain-containing protein n=1 Tax=Uliginosibacterium gangwonense TaxID=392736 RepID=UPI00035C2853|nr:heavy metal-associated domain-containing protein [Uliginosibacterium gangwonense]